MNRLPILSIAPVSLQGICVVIPAFNEQRLVGQCVESVLAAGVGANQVFVVNDCSTDRTREVVAAFAGVHIVDNPTRLGKVRGLERAIHQHRLAERFEFMAVLDADSHVDAGYFTAVVNAFRADSEAVLVCGSPRSERANWLTAFRALDYAMGDWVYRRGQQALGVITVAPGCASTYRTSIVPLLDWNGGTLVEDMDLTIQVHRKRLGTVRYVPGALSYTQDPRRLGDYIGQITRWYSGTWQVMRLRRLPFGRQRIDLEIAFLAGEGLVYSAFTLLLPLIALFAPTVVWRWLVLDQLITLAAAVVCACRLRRLDVLLWSPSFIVLRLINCVLWLRTFWTEIVRRNTLTMWFTPERYQQSLQRQARMRRPQEVFNA